MVHRATGTALGNDCFEHRPTVLFRLANDKLSFRRDRGRGARNSRCICCIKHSSCLRRSRSLLSRLRARLSQIIFQTEIIIPYPAAIISRIFSTSAINSDHFHGSSFLAGENNSLAFSRRSRQTEPNGTQDITPLPRGLRWNKQFNGREHYSD